MSELKNYRELVKQARKLVKARHELKYEIAKISLKACDKIKGGHIGKNSYTVKRFADDIGLNANTLHRWRREYELVISKIKDKKISRKALEETLKQVAHGTKKEVVAAIYSGEKSKLATKEDYYVRDIVKRLKTIDFAISCNLILSKCNQGDLQTIKELCDNVSISIQSSFNGVKVINSKRVSALKEVNALLS